MKSIEFAAKIWALWENVRGNISFAKYVLNINWGKSFSENIEHMYSKFGISQDVEKDIEEKAKELVSKWRADGINCITRANMNDVPLLERVGTDFIFFKGNSELLNTGYKESVAVVGARQTPDELIDWIRDYLPEDKLIVSGLAFGADTLGHLVAMENNSKIAVFPGTDIYKINPRDDSKKKIIEYAKDKGIILSAVFPGAKTFDKSFFIKRNAIMAEASSETFSVYFSGRSGTTSMLTESIALKNKLYVSSELVEENEKFRQSNSVIDFLFNKWEVI